MDETDQLKLKLNEDVLKMKLRSNQDKRNYDCQEFFDYLINLEKSKDSCSKLLNMSNMMLASSSLLTKL